MGEEGTAGQVGGLESSSEVRKRLANESRSWRCGGCGDNDADDGSKRGVTNEERMKWWWNVCRDKGVDVEKEVEDIESLPDGMKVEARAVKGSEDASREQSSEKKDTSTPTNTRGVSNNQVQPSISNHTAAQTETSSQDVATLVRQREPEIAQQPNNPVLQGNSAQTQQSLPQERREQPLMQVPQRVAPTESMVTIDRAIAGVFLALILMILKKVLYPSSAGLLGGGYDDLRLVRE